MFRLIYLTTIFLLHLTSSRTTSHNLNILFALAEPVCSHSTHRAPWPRSRCCLQIPLGKPGDHDWRFLNANADDRLFAAPPCAINNVTSGRGLGCIGRTHLARQNSPEIRRCVKTVFFLLHQCASVGTDNKRIQLQRDCLASFEL